MHFTKMTQKEILELINPLMDNCLAGSNEDNHDKHVKDFTGRMKLSSHLKILKIN